MRLINKFISNPCVIRVSFFGVYLYVFSVSIDLWWARHLLWITGKTSLPVSGWARSCYWSMRVCLPGNNVSHCGPDYKPIRQVYQNFWCVFPVMSGIPRILYELSWRVPCPDRNYLIINRIVIHFIIREMFINKVWMLGN